MKRQEAAEKRKKWEEMWKNAVQKRFMFQMWHDLKWDVCRHFHWGSKFSPSISCFCFFFFKLAEFDSRDSTRDWQYRLCDFGCVLFCASHWEEYGQSLHLLFPPGWLVRHVTVAANPDPLLPRKGQPASQHSPLVTCQKFVFFFGGVNVGPGLQALQRVYIFPFRDTFIIKKNNNNIAPSMLIHWGQTISFSFSFAAR